METTPLRANQGQAETQWWGDVQDTLLAPGGPEGLWSSASCCLLVRLSPCSVVVPWGHSNGAPPLLDTPPLLAQYIPVGEGMVDPASLQPAPDISAGLGVK